MIINIIFTIIIIMITQIGTLFPYFFFSSLFQQEKKRKKEKEMLH